MSKKWILLISTIVVAACAQKPKLQQDASATSATIPQLSGTWQSPQVERTSNARLAKRSLRLTPTRYEYRTEVYADREMKKPLYTFREEGGYTLEPTANTETQNFNMQLRPNRRYLTAFPKDSKEVRDLGFSGCDLRPGQESEISLSGCGLFANVDTCNQQYDILQIVDGNLHIGQRPSDLNICETYRRPSEFGPVLEKQ